MFTVDDNKDGTATIKWQNESTLVEVATVTIEDDTHWAEAVAKLTA